MSVCKNRLTKYLGVRIWVDKSFKIITIILKKIRNCNITCTNLALIYFFIVCKKKNIKKIGKAHVATFF